MNGLINNMFIDIEKWLIFRMHDYDIFWHHLQNQAKGSRGILLPKAYSTSKGVSYEVYVSVKKELHIY